MGRDDQPAFGRRGQCLTMLGRHREAPLGIEIQLGRTLKHRFFRPNIPEKPTFLHNFPLYTYVQTRSSAKKGDFSNPDNGLNVGMQNGAMAADEISMNTGS
jgi:hypothetical protein